MYPHENQDWLHLRRRILVKKRQGKWMAECTICHPTVSTLPVPDQTIVEAYEAGLWHWALRHQPPEEVELEPIPERPDHA